MNSMADCQTVYNFLAAITRRAAVPSAPDSDLATLQQLGLVRMVSPAEYAQLTQDIAALSGARGQAGAEQNERASLAAQLRSDEEKTHSILFHLEGHEKRDLLTQREVQEAAALQSVTSDLAARGQAIDQLVAKESLLATMQPYGGGYLGLTSAGSLALRDLGVRLYRVSDVAFATYWQQAQRVLQELNDTAQKGGHFYADLAARMPGVDPSYLWSIAIGLAKRDGDPVALETAFLDAYTAVGALTSNAENRLMAAELVSVVPRSAADALPILSQLDRDVRAVGVPKESSLGVAAVLLLGQRQDGTFATAHLPPFLQLTKSYEAAALLAIVNRPIEDLQQKFLALRSMFGGWGFQVSEDTELSASYLTVSDLPVEGISTKLAILARGMASYLQYPLVAAAVLASIPVLEANETLQLLEQAYGILGRVAQGLRQSELITLAVRMVHGIRAETVTGLDATATVAPAAATGYYAYGPRFYFVPIFVAHGAYYSTFSAFGGAHPGHAHAFGGFTG
jgi:hypothetical protein